MKSQITDVLIVGDDAIGLADRMPIVYFLLAPSVGLCKIGSTYRPFQRFEELQAMSPVPLELVGWLVGTERDERDYHHRFERHRSHGEWFAWDGIRDEVTADCLLDHWRRLSPLQKQRVADLILHRSDPLADLVAQRPIWPA